MGVLSARAARQAALLVQVLSPVSRASPHSTLTTRSALMSALLGLQLPITQL